MLQPLNQDKNNKVIRVSGEIFKTVLTLILYAVIIMIVLAIALFIAFWVGDSLAAFNNRNR